MKRRNWEQTVGNHWPYQPFGRPTYVAEEDNGSGAVVYGEIDTVNPKARWQESPSAKDGGYTLRVTRIDGNRWNDQLDSHQEYKNIIGNQLDVINAPAAENVMQDVTETLYERRPNFPRVFNSLSRAQFVGDLLINRTAQNKPIRHSRRNR